MASPAKIYDEAPDDFEFYMPQLVTFLLSGSSQKESYLLRHFLLDKCGRSHVFAHKMHWFLTSFCAPQYANGVHGDGGGGGAERGSDGGAQEGRKKEKGKDGQKETEKEEKRRVDGEFVTRIIEEVEAKGCLAIARETAAALGHAVEVAIEGGGPAEATHITGGSEAWVGDLQSKGIILLVRTPPEELDGAGPMTIAKSGAPVGSSKSIEELASKTTPTCLSSYLN